MHYIIFDLETTCWESDYPVRNREVIEFGAVMLNAYGQEVSRFHKLVRPEQHPRISPYCVRLTGITQAEVDSGVSFEKCHKAFINWYEQVDSPWHFVAWGRYDEQILNDQCDWHQLDHMLDGIYLNAKRAYHRIRKLDYRIGLMKALKREGITPEGDMHRALPDAVNLTKLFKIYLGEWPL